jgi:hypothetical protein
MLLTSIGSFVSLVATGHVLAASKKRKLGLVADPTFKPSIWGKAPDQQRYIQMGKPDTQQGFIA